jgi:hypothetical protein
MIRKYGLEFVESDICAHVIKFTNRLNERVINANELRQQQATISNSLLYWFSYSITSTNFIQLCRALMTIHQHLNNTAGI